MPALPTMAQVRAAQKRKATNNYYKTMPRFKKARTSMPQRAPPATRGYTPNSVELKVADVAVGTVNVNTTGSFNLICNPTLGSDFTNRIGRKIRIKSYYVRGYVVVQAALVPTSPISTGCQMGRMIVFFDCQPNGAAPAVTDLLNTASPSSHLNLNNRDRFKILTDKTFVFDPFVYNTTATQSVITGTNTIRPLKKYKRCDLEVIYNATSGGTIADINSGALYMFWIGSTASGTSQINAVVGTRVRYSDQ